ncbi:NAD(P)/FAD-dependent oxidoreductase [Glycomyces xiaoerkulensis]|uniref:NAD(P)/FAD-dependent oxidoreductase n=1 Tax=Glycomyces xiaoerkulensis TaxID=2038139 RepID=UPI0018E4B28D|nr:FAD-dependent oxidoreductase [Glycomyces xiaoerkulensis]
MKRIVVIGAGHVGFYVAERLSKKLRSDIKRGHVELMVIDPNQHMTYQPFLPEAAAGNISPRHGVVPLRQALKHCTILTGGVTEIHHAERRLVVQPLAGPTREVEYDQVVLAPGSVSRPLPIPGLADTAIGIKTMGEAIWLRNHVLQRFDVAAATEDPDLRRKALTFVTVGGGFAGAETLGELEDLTASIVDNYPEIDPDEIKWYLVEYADKILPEVGPQMGAYAARQLTKRGIDIRLGTTLKSCEGGHVVLTDGEEFDSDTIIWTAGVMPNPLLKKSDLPIGPKGHLEVNTRLQVATGVEAATDQTGEVVEGAWGAGDSAQVPDTTDFPLPYCTPSAQHAVRQATRLADNVHAAHVGAALKPYHHKYIGSVAGLGLYKGVANTYGFKAKGMLAWLMHRGYHLSRVPGVGRKGRILADWIVGFFTKREMVQLGEIGLGREPFEAIAAGADPVRAKPTTD